MNEEVAGTVREKTVVEVHESYEPAKLALGLGLRKITDCPGTGEIPWRLMWCPRKLREGGTKLAFVRVNYDSVRRQSGEYCP